MTLAHTTDTSDKVRHSARPRCGAAAHSVSGRQPVAAAYAATRAWRAAAGPTGPPAGPADTARWCRAHHGTHASRRCTGLPHGPAGEAWHALATRDRNRRPVAAPAPPARPRRCGAHARCTTEPNRRQRHTGVLAAGHHWDRATRAARGPHTSDWACNTYQKTTDRMHAGLTTPVHIGTQKRLPSALDCRPEPDCSDQRHQTHVHTLLEKPTTEHCLITGCLWVVVAKPIIKSSWLPAQPQQPKQTDIARVKSFGAPHPRHLCNSYGFLRPRRARSSRGRIDRRALSIPMSVGGCGSQAVVYQRIFWLLPPPTWMQMSALHSAPTAVRARSAAAHNAPEQRCCGSWSTCCVVLGDPFPEQICYFMFAFSRFTRRAQVQWVSPEKMWPDVASIIRATDACPCDTG